MPQTASPLRRLYELDAYQSTTLPRSFWADSVGALPACQVAPTADTLKTDIAIIGGGYTGLSAALRLAQSGRSVSVFDAGRPGWGASGRNGGFCCLGGSIHSFGILAKQFGEDASRQFATHQRAAIDLVAHRISNWQANVDRHSDGEMVLAHKASRIEDLHEEARELNHFTDIKSTFHTADSLREMGMNANGVAGGLHVKAGFGLHPFKYLAALHKACLAAGVQIFEQAEIQDIDETPANVILQCGDCRITADHAIIATNGYSAENLPDWIGGKLMPVFSGIFVTRPMSNDELAAQGWTSDLMAFDSRILLHYFRKLPDSRFLFGGRGGITATPAAFDAGKRDLLANFNRMFPAWRDIELTHHWNGLACLSQSWRPYIGRVPGHRDVWTALAWHGNGVALASQGGKLLAQRMQGAIGDEDLGAVLGTPMHNFPLPKLRRVARSAAYRYYGLRDRFA